MAVRAGQPRAGLQVYNIQLHVRGGRQDGAKLLTTSEGKIEEFTDLLQANARALWLMKNFNGPGCEVKFEFSVVPAGKKV